VAASALPSTKQVMQEHQRRPISRPTAEYHDRETPVIPAGLAVCAALNPGKPRSGIAFLAISSGSVSFCHFPDLP